MQIAVVGAGIVGVTTAHELAQDGHEVTVFERHGSVAADTSFANAGLVAPGYVTPWAAPGMPGKVLRHLFARHAPVRLNGRLDAATLGWMWKWWRACGHASYQAHRASMQRLALYSRQRLHEVRQELELDYERSDGFLVLLRSAQDLALAQPGLTMLNELGIKHSVLDPRRCAAVEPGLNPETPLHAGIYLPDDEVGNCRQFAMLLRGQAQARGVRFRFHTDVQRIVPGPRPQVVRQATSSEDSVATTTTLDQRADDDIPTVPMAPGPVTEPFDAVVVCAAIGSAALLAPHGLKLPLVPIYGYSVTAPMRQHDSGPDRQPRSAVMDERYKVAISRLGSRVRVAGGAELGGRPARHNEAAIDTLYKVLDDWYPGVARLTHAQRWKGARPMLPDGPPVLGKSDIDGVWLNLGHGSSGWALACGSARVLADLLAGRAPAVDTRGFGIERLRR
ncbi:FAD-dependent oxidoreductase [Piscinibacter sp.]|uniref:FAD-dependent oxidoreductase n=1 Tax=Piscinibacter sp. TaxID=1903157 RepID=UPI002C615E99|nr:FAD-dependent oxidoreductase [Albitalea sp.]HUG26530.1 FAD-dependent oxidoreductase [Albitalea sp.]